MDNKKLYNLWLAVAISAVVGMACTAILSDIHSRDYDDCLQYWMQYIRTHGRFASLGDPFHNYNPPYIYLLSAISYVPCESLKSIRLLSVAFSIAGACYIAGITGLVFGRHSWRTPMAGALALIIPTVLLNSAVWAQCDAIYSAFLFAALYYALCRRSRMCMLMCGLSLSFKMQALFLAPVFLIFLLKDYIRWRDFWIIPCVYLLLLLPAAAAGYPIADLLTIYTRQSQLHPGIYSLNYPNPYIWATPGEVSSTIHIAALLLGASIILGSTWWMWQQTKHLHALPVPMMVFAAFVCGFLVPFALPSMHERYMYPAEALTAAMITIYPRRTWLWILVPLASTLTYWKVLSRIEDPLLVEIATVIMCVAVAAILIVFCKSVRSGSYRPTPTAQSFKTI